MVALNRTLTCQHLSIPRISVAFLNVFVGGLILVRSAELVSPGARELVILKTAMKQAPKGRCNVATSFGRFPSAVFRVTSFGSLISCGVLFLWAQPLGDWPLGLSIYFSAGALIALVSFLYLGKSFAVLPSLRQVKTKGPYRLVRHPAYFGELNMALACALAAGTKLAWATWIIAVGLTVIRIRFEEQLLLQSPDYKAYSEHVKKRLLPGVW